MPARSSFKTYTVVKGDTLGAIAKRFGSTVAAIARASGIANPDKIEAGQQLLIPVAATPAQSSPKSAPVAPAATLELAPDEIAPVISIATPAQIAEWFKPPRLWVTLGVVASLAYYIVYGRNSRTRLR